VKSIWLFALKFQILLSGLRVEQLNLHNFFWE